MTTKNLIDLWGVGMVAVGVMIIVAALVDMFISDPTTVLYVVAIAIAFAIVPLAVGATLVTITSRLFL